MSDEDHRGAIPRDGSRFERAPRETAAGAPGASATAKATAWIPLAITLAVLLGAVAGYFVPGFFTATEFVGIILINVLKIVAIPLILVSVVVGIASLGDLAKLGRTGATALLYFLGTTLVAAVIGLIVVLVLNPGSGFPETLKDAANWPQVSAESKSFSEIVSQIIPSNLMTALGNDRFLGLILLAFCTGGLLAAMGGKVRTLVSLFRQANDVVMELIRFILPFAPIGVFWLVGAAVAKDGQYLAKTSAMGWLVLTLVIGLAIHGLAVLPAVLKVWGKRSPLALARDAATALLTAFGTSSAAATLPVTYEAVTERSRVDRRASSLVLPLGSAINLNGTAMFLVIAAVFIAQAFGVDLSWFQLLALVGGSVLMSFAAAGVPHAGALMLTSVMTIAGFPGQAFLALGFVFALEWLLGRLATVVDVWGDIVGAAVVAESFELKLAGAGSAYRSGAPDRGRGPSDRGRGLRSDSGPRDRGERRPPDSRDQDRSRPEPAVARPGAGDSSTARPPRVSESPFAITGGGGPVLGPPVKIEPVGEDRPPKERSAEERPKESSRRDDGDNRRRDRDRRQPRDQRDEGGRGRRPQGRRLDESRQQERRQGDRSQEDRSASDRERQPDQSPRGPETPAGESERNRLKPDVVARDLARVSAQLSGAPAPDGANRPADTPREDGPMASSDDRDYADTLTPVVPEIIRPSYDEIDTTDEPWDEADESESFANDTDEYVDDEEDVISEEEAEEPAAPLFDETPASESADDSTADAQGVRFGRSKARKGQPPRHENESTESAPTPEMPSPKDNFSTDDAVFGRARRRRTR